MNLIGTKAPEWSGTAHVKGEQRPLSSKDYDGKWYVIYWYPLDFTWVCPTEIRGFQALLDDFSRESIDVIGVSTDSFYSHQAWFRDRKIFPEEITHPVLADTNHSISRAFDVLKEQAGVAFRATVIVDDHGIVRSLNINDVQVGRSPAEVLRTVQALQSGEFCPADWSKGEAYAAPTAKVISAK
jgi:peroxiredoxin (alkyl hydroperoxide reductase subunit C)